MLFNDWNFNILEFCCTIKVAVYCVLSLMNKLFVSKLYA